MTAFGSPAVEQAFGAIPAPVRRKLLALRRLILETAAATEGVGEIEETLKWGEPAYLTPRTRSGSPVRLGWKQARPGEYAMYFNCRTTLVETFRTLFPRDLRFEGNRAIVFHAGDAVPRDVLRFCVAQALTYHERKRRGGGR
jgi:hypothetical protein